MDNKMEALCQYVLYEPETGLFYRKSNGRQVGRSSGPNRRKIWFDGKTYSASRVAWLCMTGNWPSSEIDHIDRDVTNNCWSNLRLATRSQNLVNRSRKRRLPLPRGVVSKGRLYRAAITVNKKRIQLGYFKTPEDAHSAYLRAATSAFGEFFPINL